jgi:hypothetical protein
MAGGGGDLVDEMKKMGPVKKKCEKFYKMVTAEGGEAVERYQAKAMGLLKISVGFSQIVGTFNVTFDVPWPPELLNIFSWCNMCNLDFVTALNFDCIGTEYTVTYPGGEARPH